MHPPKGYSHSPYPHLDIIKVYYNLKFVNILGIWMKNTKEFFKCIIWK